MSATSQKRSEDFLKISEQFQLGALTTETSHPVTANLSETAKHDVPAALRLLFDVDHSDVVQVDCNMLQTHKCSHENSPLVRTIPHVLPDGEVELGSRLYCRPENNQLVADHESCVVLIEVL